MSQTNSDQYNEMKLASYYGCLSLIHSSDGKFYLGLPSHSSESRLEIPREIYEGLLELKDTAPIRC